MKKLCHYLKRVDLYPACEYEWQSIYPQNLLDFLLNNDCIEYSSKYDLVDTINAETTYKINFIEDTYYGHCEEIDEVKTFTEEELRCLNINEEKFAKLICESLGYTKNQAVKFQYGANAYHLGGFKVGKVNYIIFLCFGTKNFKKDFQRFLNEKEKTVPIIYALDENFINDRIGNFIAEQGGYIVPISDSFELLHTKLKCLKTPKELIGITEQAKTKSKHNSSDVWTGKFPKNATWKDITIKLRKADDWLIITYKNQIIPYFHKDISFFTKSQSSDNSSRFWTLLKKVIYKTATSKDETTRHDITKLNKHLSKFFKLPNSPLGIKSNRQTKLYETSFSIGVIEQIEKNPNKIRKQIFNPYD